MKLIIPPGSRPNHDPTEVRIYEDGAHRIYITFRRNIPAGAKGRRILFIGHSPAPIVRPDNSAAPILSNPVIGQVLEIARQLNAERFALMNLTSTIAPNARSVNWSTTPHRHQVAALRRELKTATDVIVAWGSWNVPITTQNAMIATIRAAGHIPFAMARSRGIYPRHFSQLQSGNPQLWQMSPLT